MRNKQHFIAIFDSNKNASISYTLAAASIYAVLYGFFEIKHSSTSEYRAIAVRLKNKYGEVLNYDQIKNEMNSSVKVVL